MAIALSLFFAQLDEQGTYYNKCYDFTMTPGFHDIKGDTLSEKFDCVAKLQAGYLTSHALLGAVLDNFLDKKMSIPRKILVFTLGSYTNVSNSKLMKQMRQKYTTLGLQIPVIVHWNTRQREGAVTKANTKDEIVISGYSVNMLEKILNDEDIETVDPTIALLQELDKPLFKKIRLC